MGRRLLKCFQHMKLDVIFFWILLVVLLFSLASGVRAESEMPEETIPSTDYLRDPNRVDNSNALQKKFDRAFNNCVSLNKDYIEQGNPLTELQFFTCMHIQGATL
ncbi:hypothetical protein SXHG_00036 [Synechococcus phage MRHenn-2013a]|nr:hypothetical protein SXHG_00036 [Synechococcus phage MRHenn-2013a]